MDEILPEGFCLLTFDFLRSVFQTIQTVRDGNLPEERTSSLHGFCEGERSPVPAVFTTTGYKRNKNSTPKPLKSNPLKSHELEVAIIFTFVF